MRVEFGTRNSEFGIDLAEIDLGRERLRGIQNSRFKIQNSTQRAAH